MEFGEQLKKLRRQHGITQAELASAIYTTIPNLSNWENGRYMPNKEAINRIADFFNVSTDYLLGRTDNPLPNVVDLGDETLCPLVGQVVAGMPIEAQENLEGYIYISYKPADEYFALRVHGESMAGVPAKGAQYLMGHATIQMTKDVYTDVQDSYIKTFDERVIMFTDTRKHKD